MDWTLITDHTRRTIIETLIKKLEKDKKSDKDKKGEITPKQLGILFLCSPSTLSIHLRTLRLSNIVKTRREGNQVFYSINEEELKKFHLEYMQCFGNILESNSKQISKKIPQLDTHIIQQNTVSSENQIDKHVVNNID